MNDRKNLNWLYRLNEEVKLYVGPGLMHATLHDLNNFLIVEKAKKRLSWHGIPISFCIKYTEPPKLPIEKLKQLTIY